MIDTLNININTKGNQMKSNESKRKLLSGVLAVVQIVTPVAIAIILTACDNGSGTTTTTQQETAKPQSTTITGLFDNNASATVKGNFTNSEWTGVAGKIKAALNARFEESGDGPKVVFRGVYTDRNVTIILEKNPSYDNYSATLRGDTIYINFAILNDIDALKFALNRATQVMGGNSLTPEIGKVIAPVPQYNRATMLRDNRIASRMARGQRLG